MKKKYDNYFIQDDVLYEMTDKGQELVAPFYPEVTKVIKRDRNYNKHAQQNQTIEFILHAGEEQSGLLTTDSLKELDYPMLWNKCNDIRLGKTEKKKLLDFFKLQMCELEPVQEIMVDHTGDFGNFYVHGKEDVIMLETEYSCFLNYDPCIPLFPRRPEIDDREIIEYVCELFELNPKIIPMLYSALCLSVLKPLISTWTSDLINVYINIFGKTGSMKTTLSKLIMVQCSQQMVNFADIRTKEIRDRAVILQGHTFLVDDYHGAVQAYRKQTKKQLVDDIARFANDNAMALIVVTSEFLEGAPSTLNRSIQIPVDKPLDEKGICQLAALQKESGILSEFVFRFAKCVYTNKKDAFRIFSKYFPQFSGKDTGSSGDRVFNNYRLLEFAYAVFYEMYSPKSSELPKDIHDIASELMEGQRIRQKNMYTEHADSDLVMMAKQAIDSTIFLQGGLIRIPSPNDLDKNDGFVFGLHDDRIYIKAYTLAAAIEKMFLIKCGVSKLTKAFSENGLLDEDNSKNHTRKGGKSGRFLVIRRDDLYNYVKVRNRL